MRVVSDHILNKQKGQTLFMNYWNTLKACTVFTLLAMLTVGCVWTVSAETQSGQILVTSVQGRATYSTDHITWRQLQPDLLLGPGAVLRTEADSTADLIMQDSGTAMRMTAGTELEVTRLHTEAAGEQTITETRLSLKSGAVIGSQRKLARPSKFDIEIPGGVATIRGTEYLVRCDGAVTCVSGEVEVRYNGFGKSHGVTVDVPAGYSFDPSTKHVVPTTPAYLRHIIADVNAVRDMARIFKVGRAIIIVKPEHKVSPHGCDGDNDDDDRGRGNGHDDRDGGRGFFGR
jgi:hypothetical protein